MDTDANVRELVEHIFGKKCTLPEEMVTRSSVPCDILNKDFTWCLTHVLNCRLVFVAKRWEKYFDDIYRKILKSHWHFVGYIMRACYFENICNENIFDSFLSVSLVILYLSEVTISKAGVDFSDMNPDIFMVFYLKEMKRNFHMREEFNQLIEYISDHKYVKWRREEGSGPTSGRLVENMKKDFDNYWDSEKKFQRVIFRDKLSEMGATEASLTRQVLSSTSVKLPDLPSEYELIKRLVDFRKTEKVNEAKKAGTALSLVTLLGKLNFSSDFNTILREPIRDAAWHEKIIEAVTRHNQSEDSGKEIVNSQIQEKASGILENLKNKIKSLIEVLDECNE